jgi:glucose-6-phosphate 1-epimerase
MDQLEDIDSLNRRCGIAGVAQVVPGNGGLPKVQVTAPAAVAEIYLHGAQVTAWKPAGAEEVIFVSDQSQWQEGKAIRGGVPICFPWFRAKADNPQAPSHGVVRTKQWRLDSIIQNADGSVAVLCSTESDESTRRWWPHEFRLTHRITVGSALCMELTASNTGPIALRFEEALHTYFRVGQIERVRVRGLDGVAYLDNTDSNRAKEQSGDVIFTSATDNAYLQTQTPLELADPVLRRTVRTETQNSATTVVWNPWQQGAASMADLGNEEWRVMACVEASNILESAINLGPGEEHTMCSILSVESH